MDQNDSQKGQDILVPTNQDHANIMGMTDLNSDTWDVIFLGKKTEDVDGERITDNLIKPIFGTSRYGAHAYIINKNSVKKLLDSYVPITYAVDVFMDETLSNLDIVSVKKSFIRQRGDLVEDELLLNPQPKNTPDSDTFWNLLYKGKLTTCSVDDIVESIEFSNYKKSSNHLKVGNQPMVSMKLRTYG